MVSWVSFVVLPFLVGLGGSGVGLLPDCSWDTHDENDIANIVGQSVVDGGAGAGCRVELQGS